MDYLVSVIQFLMFGSLMLLVTIPVALIACLGNYFFRRTNRRGILITGSFVLGAFVSGSVLWHLVPPEWNLSFWETFEAAGNARKYGHPVEHYAECVVMLLLFAAAFGGAAGAGVAALIVGPHENIARP